MRFAWIPDMIGFLLCLFISFGFSQQKVSVLAIGEALTVPTPPGTSIRVQKKGLLRIQDQNHSIRLVGKKLGSTKIYLGSKTLEVRILPKKSYVTFQSLKRWSQGKRGPYIEVQGSDVIVKGRILRAQDFFELEPSTQGLGPYKIQAHFSKEIRDKIKSSIREKLENNNLIFGQLIWSPQLIMSLDASQEKHKGEYKKILQNYGIPVQFDSQQFNQKKMVEIRLYIAHVKKSFLRNWGIQWPNEFKAQPFSSGSPLFSDIQVSLQSLEQEGIGKTLASPTLVTESGQSAQFHSGGEFPIPTSNGFSNNVSWKSYGLTIKAHPKVNAQNHLHIEIHIEISTLDPSKSQDGIPALNRSFLTTQINMSQAKPFFLSGLVQKLNSQSSQGLPWLRQVPIFSPLFSSGTKMDDDSELIFVMVPKVYES